MLADRRHAVRDEWKTRRPLAYCLVAGPRSPSARARGGGASYGFVMYAAVPHHAPACPASPHARAPCSLLRATGPKYKSGVQAVGRPPSPGRTGGDTSPHLAQDIGERQARKCFDSSHAASSVSVEIPPSEIPPPVGYAVGGFETEQGTLRPSPSFARDPRLGGGTLRSGRFGGGQRRLGAGCGDKCKQSRLAIQAGASSEAKGGYAMCRIGFGRQIRGSEVTCPPGSRPIFPPLVHFLSFRFLRRLSILPRPTTRVVPALSSSRLLVQENPSPGSPIKRGRFSGRPTWRWGCAGRSSTRRLLGGKAACVSSWVSGRVLAKGARERGKKGSKSRTLHHGVLCRVDSVEDDETCPGASCQSLLSLPGALLPARPLPFSLAITPARRRARRGEKAPAGRRRGGPSYRQRRRGPAA